MPDRWNETHERDWRDRGYGREQDYGADDPEGREDRSFQPRGPRERGRVFGERETGASYAGPRYGASGYTGYGDRAYGERGYGERNYSTGGDYRAGPERGRREVGPGAYEYDRAFRADRDTHSEFGFGYDLGGNNAPLDNRGDYQRTYGRQDGPATERSQRVFGRDEGYERQVSHRGLGPQGYRRSDARIAEDIHDRLTEDHHVDASNISVQVREGEVTLTGSVDSRHAKHHAEHVVEDVSGVGHVQNNLRVESRTTPRGATTNAQTPLGENTKLSDQAAGKA